MTNPNPNTPAPVDLSDIDTDGDPEMAALVAEIQALRGENTALKEKSKRTATVTVKSSCLIGDTDGQGNPGKGTVGVYGTSRFPISAYPNQWMKVLQNAASVAQYIIDNQARLGFKEGQQEQVVSFMTNAMPALKGLAEVE